MYAFTMFGNRFSLADMINACKCFPVVYVLLVLSACSSGTGVPIQSINSQANIERHGYVYIARESGFLTEKTQIDVVLNGNPLGSLTPTQYAIGRSSGALNTLKVQASGLAASFYPSETYRFSRRGRSNHYFIVGFEHGLTYDFIILRQVTRSEWIRHIGVVPGA